LAKQYLDKGLELSEKTKYQEGLLSSYSAFGKLYMKLNQPQEAVNYYTKALALAEKIKSLPGKMDTYKNLYEAYKKTTNTDKALEYHELYTEAKDSLFSSEKAEKIAQVESRYQFEQELAEQKRIEEEQKRKEEQLAEEVRVTKQKENRLEYSAILIVILFLFVGVFFSGRFTLKPRVIEIMVFFTIILLFEFILVALDPTIDTYSGGSPVFKLSFYVVVALGIFPLHSFLEERLKLRIIKKKRKAIKSKL